MSTDPTLARYRRSERLVAELARYGVEAGSMSHAHTVSITLNDAERFLALLRGKEAKAV